MTVAESEVILTRRLVVAARRGRAMRECLLEVQFNPGRKWSREEPAFASFRITPFDDWRRAYGEDLIQAVELAIRMAYLEAEGWGADWPDETDTSMPLPR